MVPFLLVMVVFFVFMILPQMRRQKKTKSFIADLKKGDHVVTTGGVHAKISQRQLIQGSGVFTKYPCHSREGGCDNTHNTVLQ